MQSRTKARLPRDHKHFLRNWRSQLVLVRRLLFTSLQAECVCRHGTKTQGTPEFEAIRFKVTLNSTLSPFMREGRRLAGVCACQSFFCCGMLLTEEDGGRHVSGDNQVIPKSAALPVSSLYCVH